MMRRHWIAIVATSLAITAAAACSSSSEEAAPSRPVRPSTNDGTDAGGAVEDAAPPDPSCIGDSGCYVCEPEKLVEYLNACTDQQCVPFDNVARLPLYKASEALPPVP